MLGLSVRVEVALAIYLLCFAVLAVSMLVYRRNAAAFWPELPTEPCCPRSPRGLLVFRGAAAALCFTVLCVQIIEFDSMRNFYTFWKDIGVFFTLWNWCLIGVMFLVGTLRQAAALRGEQRYGQLHLVLLELAVPVAPFVSAATWGLLLPFAYLSTGNPGGLLYAYSFLMHLGNTVLCCAEFVASKPRFEKLHVVLMYSWTALYLIAATTAQLLGVHAPYFFLDISKPMTICWMLGFLLVTGGLYAGWVRVSKWQQVQAKRALELGLEGLEKTEGLEGLAKTEAPAEGLP